MVWHPIIDWSGCDLVEIVEGKVSGAPLVKGTRIPASVIVQYFEAGCSIDEIVENYPSVSAEQVHILLSYAAAHRMATAS